MKSPVSVALLFVIPFVLGYCVLFSFSLRIALAVLVSIPCIAVVLYRPFFPVLAFVFTWSFSSLLALPITAGGFKLSTLILIAAFLIWTVKAFLVKDRDLFITPLGKPVHVLVLTLFIISLISILNGRNLEGSLVQVQRFAYCVIIYFFLLLCVKETSEVKKIIFVFVGAGFIVSLFGMAEGMGWDVYSRLNNRSLLGSSLPLTTMIRPGSRIHGLAADADFHGMYMAVVFVFSLYLFFVHSSKGLRLFYSVVMLLSVINIVGAGSRSAALGFLFSLVIFWVFVELRFKWLFSVLMLGGILLLGFFMLTLVPDLDIERFYRPTGKAKSTLELRKNNVMIGLAMSLDSPLFGHGPDGFMANYHRYAPRVVPSATKRLTSPLNVYLQILVEYGIIGITAFLSILGLAIKSLFVSAKRLSGTARYLPAVILSSLCGYSVFAAFAGGYTNQCYWIILALSAIMGSIDRRLQKRVINPSLTDVGEHLNPSLK
ncbi:MAG: O-antigen ligase family protein [Desulfobacterales bacterium]|nr:O-antigen ligase family protein [Desulfobacterales bacterium]